VAAHGVVVLPLPFDEDLGLAERVEELPTEVLVPGARLAVVVLPGAAGSINGDLPLFPGDGINILTPPTPRGMAQREARVSK
jgi:hypothetical protein